MRAVTLPSFGGPEAMVLADVDPPTLGPGEVLVDVVATAVNRADLMQRRGHYPPPAGASSYLGLECSGRIAALGDDVSGWAVGDEVCALLAGGGYAEQVAVPVGQLLPVPAGVSLLHAAGLAEVACTVWSNVFDLAALQPGEHLLVHGGTSGIGTMAVQLAKRHGARVTVTVGSPQKAERAKALGADATVLYKEQDFADVVEPADVILDNMAAAYLGRNVRALAPDGRLVVIGLQGGVKGELDLAALLAKRGSVHATSLRGRPAAQKAAVVAGTLAYVWPAIEAGDVVPVIDQVLPLTEVARAHQVLEDSTHVGKVLLQVR